MADTDTMRVVQIPEAGGEFEVTRRPLPDPGPGEVRLSVEACGVCRGDVHVREGNPAVEYPRVPGHEIVGTIDAVGSDVRAWREGQRVGVGWHGGHCGRCRACRRGSYLLCDESVVTGRHRDGGYAEFTLADRDALVEVPDGMASTDAAPLLCAGLTTFNALRNADARPGDLVAVVGIGGLGHLGIQFARQAGFETVAISRRAEKREAAKGLGADHFVDSTAADVASELQRLGGANVVLSTAPSADAVADTLGGLDESGEAIVLGSPGAPVPVSVGHLSRTRGGISGWASGPPRDAEDTLEFCALRSISPVIETFGLEEAEPAYRRMVDTDVRFRAVLTP